MDRARLSRGRDPHLPPREARILQPGRFVGRRAARRMGNDRGGEIVATKRDYFFGVAEGAAEGEPAANGAGLPVAS